MNKDLQRQPLLRAILPQIIILILLAALYFLSFCGLISSPHELNKKLIELFSSYGMPIVAISSFLENLIGINAYFPGAFTILTGMALTAGHPSKAVLMYVAIYLPAYAANLLSFFLGTWQSQDTQKNPVPTQRGNWTLFFLTYWHPQLAAITAFSVGARKRTSMTTFFIISSVVSFCWSVFWALVIYHFGFVADLGDYFLWMFLAYLVIWTALDVWKYFRKSSAS